MPDEVTLKWARWADAAEDYAKAAIRLERSDSQRGDAIECLRAAVEAMGCDPMGLLKTSSVREHAG